MATQKCGTVLIVNVQQINLGGRGRQLCDKKESKNDLSHDVSQLGIRKRLFRKQIRGNLRTVIAHEGLERSKNSLRNSNEEQRIFSNMSCKSYKLQMNLIKTMPRSCLDVLPKPHRRQTTTFADQNVARIQYFNSYIKCSDLNIV